MTVYKLKQTYLEGLLLPMLRFLYLLSSHDCSLLNEQARSISGNTMYLRTSCGPEMFGWSQRRSVQAGSTPCDTLIKRSRRSWWFKRLKRWNYVGNLGLFGAGIFNLLWPSKKATMPCGITRMRRMCNQWGYANRCSGLAYNSSAEKRDVTPPLSWW